MPRPAGIVRVLRTVWCFLSVEFPRRPGSVRRRGHTREAAIGRTRRRMSQLRPEVRLLERYAEPSAHAFCSL
ncbi:hypothetical protein GCM10010446_40150 [Streptomyces enissocaesilis]|uniref:Secreted protein n=1 Tax=Streptomyces enissocaesilis TaxID=332589 RepID=A0ABN3XGJ4_9ACTN